MTLSCAGDMSLILAPVYLGREKRLQLQQKIWQKQKTECTHKYIFNIFITTQILRNYNQFHLPILLYCFSMFTKFKGHIQHRRLRTKWTAPLKWVWLTMMDFSIFHSTCQQSQTLEHQRHFPSNRAINSSTNIPWWHDMMTKQSRPLTVCRLTVQNLGPYGICYFFLNSILFVPKFHFFRFLFCGFRFCVFLTPKKLWVEAQSCQMTYRCAGLMKDCRVKLDMGYVWSWRWMW